MKRKGGFDYILLETTGLADPGNLAPLFWLDEGLGSTIYLDGIVTLIDAKHILLSLDDTNARLQSEQKVDGTDLTEDGGHSHKGPEYSTAHLQISHADVIVLNKTDLVSLEQLNEVTNRIRSINSLAKFHTTNYSQIPQLEGVILDLHAYDNVDADALDFAAKGHSHLDPAISTIVMAVPALDESQLDKLDKWLRSLLWEGLFLCHPDADAGTFDKGTTERTDIHRIKGRLPMTDGSMKLLQGVREVFEFLDGGKIVDDTVGSEAQTGKIVLIGRNIGGKEGKQRLQSSLDLAMDL